MPNPYFIINGTQQKMYLRKGVCKIKKHLSIVTSVVLLFSDNKIRSSLTFMLMNTEHQD